MPLKAPRPLRIVGNAILIFFAIVGGILSLAQFPELWQPENARTIILKADDSVLVSQSTFGSLLEFNGTALGNEQMVLTTITLWRDGGAPIDADMVRRPLEFRMPAGSRIADVQITDEDSSVADNFAVERTSDSVVLKWKIFDPDMAVKIAIARFGGMEPVVHLDNLGPGVDVTKNRYNAAKSVYYWGVIVVSFLMIVAFMSTLNLGGLEKATSAIDKLIAKLPKWVEVILAVIFVVIFLVSVVGIVVGSLRMIPWLQALVVPPIPFA